MKRETKTKDGFILSRSTPEGVELTLKDKDGWFRDDTVLSIQQTIELIHGLIQILDMKALKGPDYVPPVHFGNVG